MENRKRGERSSPSFHDGKKEDSKVTQKSETVITTAEEEKFHVKEKKGRFFSFPHNSWQRLDEGGEKKSMRK